MAKADASIKPDTKAAAGAADDKPVDDAAAAAAAAAAGAGADDAAGADKTTFTKAELDAALAADRAEQTRLAKAATKKQERDAELSEGERMKQRAEAAEASLRLHDARSSVEREAQAAGFANPSKIYRLLKDDLSFDDAGKPENVKDLIAAAKRDFPEEIAAKTPGSADGSAGKGAAGAGKGTMNDFLRAATGRK